MRNLIALSIVVILLLFIVSPAQAGPIPPNGDAVVVQGSGGNDSHVDVVNFSFAPNTATFSQLFPTTGDYGIRINNMGYNPVDGLLYAWRIPEYVVSPANPGTLLTIDSAGTISLLGALGMPTTATAGNSFGANLNSGDVSSDGNWMYLTNSGGFGNGKLYVVDLTTLTLSATLTITNVAGRVNDWVYNPNDGLLYGGISGNTSQIATLDPSTGARSTVSVTGGALSATGIYGAAWRSAWDTLFIYDNNGPIYELSWSGAILNTWAGQATTDNDGASFVPVPVPPAVILGILGLCAVGIKLRKYA